VSLTVVSALIAAKVEVENRSADRTGMDDPDKGRKFSLKRTITQK